MTLWIVRRPNPFFFQLPNRESDNETKTKKQIPKVASIRQATQMFPARRINSGQKKEKKSTLTPIEEFCKILKRNGRAIEKKAISKSKRNQNPQSLFCYVLDYSEVLPSDPECALSPNPAHIIRNGGSLDVSWTDSIPVVQVHLDLQQT